MGQIATDPVIVQYREQISDNDLKILEALNKRIKLVEKLKEYKESRGIDFVDPEREDWLFTYLARLNRGPISNDGVREVFAAVLDVVKREIAARQDTVAK
ncbi:MAG: chorismate mutase [Thermoleophilia bacterium]|nr:chorismate mutase [Thermoleophilia bacterium]